MTIDAAGLKGWQWLFILEGLPSVLLGLVMLVGVCWLIFFRARNRSHNPTVPKQTQQFCSQ
jgi:hypothetical protein